MRDLLPGMTIAAVRRTMLGLFRAIGIDTAELDARVLLAHALRVTHGGLISQSDRVLDRSEIERVSAVTRRRLAREPVARIVNEKEFWGLAFALNSEVLIPRPETEGVVEWALDLARLAGRRERLRLADLGTGSGAILVALLHELPEAFGVGTDLSLEALHIARENASRAGVAERAAFVACDFGQALGGGLDLVVSNPPYVACAAIEMLAPEVRMFEPRRALDGGDDGLSCYRRIASDARRLLRPGGHIVVEIGAGQEPIVSKLFTEQGLRLAGPARRDLAGIPRVLCLMCHDG